MILQKVNYNNLYSFHVIASEGSVAGAANRLGVAPSTLSEQLGQLEKAFRVQLFERRNARLVLNEAGRIVYRHTRVMFKTSERLLHTLSVGDISHKITLDLGISSSVSRSFAIEYFVPLFEDENVHVRVKHADYDYLINDLLGQEIDILLSDRQPAEVQENELISEIIQRSPLLLVATEKYEEQYESREEPLPFLNYSPHSNYRMEVDHFFQERTIPLNPLGELDDSLLMKAAVAKGLCCAILPEPTVRRELQSGEFKILDRLPNIESQIFMSYHKQKPMEHVLRAIERLRGTMQYSEAPSEAISA